MLLSPSVVLPTILLSLAAQPMEQTPSTEPSAPVPGARTTASDIPVEATQTIPTAEQQAQSHFEAGRQAFLVGDFDRAIEAFEASYNLSQNSDLLYNISLAYLRRYEVSHQRSDLDRARVVATNLRDELSREPDVDLTSVDQLLAEITRKLASEDAMRPAPAPEPKILDVEGPPEPAPSCPDPTLDNPPNRKQRLAGGVLLGTGAGLLTGGVISVAYFALKGREFKSTLVDLDNQFNNECADASSSRCEALQGSIDTTINNGRQANILAGTIGAGLMTLGTAGIVTGAVVLGRTNKRARQARLQVAPTWSGAMLSGKF